MEYSINLLTNKLSDLNHAIKEYKNSKGFNPNSSVYKDTQSKIRDLERGIRNDRPNYYQIVNFLLLLESLFQVDMMESLI